MSAPIPAREEEIYTCAVEMLAADRASFLDRACAADSTLRARVEALLRANEAARSFLESPPAASLAEAVARNADPFADLSAAGLSKGKVETSVGNRIGRYKLLQHLGEGGCGVVFMAEQEEPVRRRVALKVIKPGMDTKEVVARFEVERQALALMDHANIARVFDAGATESGRPFFVMELVRGIPITRFCDEQNLPTRARLELFTAVCHAVQHAHQKGIIHRDLKPSNILVTLHDGVPVPKVIDFGIAKATQGRLTDATLFTAFEQFIGTPAYMSPEQAELSGLDIDTRSDIYSLGVLLYELLTGRTPFDAKSLVAAGLDEIRRIIREVDPPKPSTCLGTLAGEAVTAAARLRQSSAPGLIKIIKGDLDWIVMRCLEKDRTRRYETADALALDLQSFVRNEPVAARQPGPWYILRKLARRHRIAVVGGGAFLLTVAGGTGLSAWILERADEAGRDTAETWRQRHLRAAARVVGDAFTLPRAEDPSIAPHPTLHAALDRAALRDPDALTGKLAPDSAGIEAHWRETLALGYLAYHNVAAALPQIERAVKATTLLTQEGDPLLARNLRERLRQTLMRMEGIVHRPPADATTGEAQARLARLKQALADLDRNASGGRSAP